MLRLSISFTTGAAMLFLAPGLVGHAEASTSLCNTVSNNKVLNCGFETGDYTSWAVTGNLQGGLNGNDVYVDNADPHSGNYDAAFGAQSQFGQTGSGNQYGPVTTLSQALTGLLTNEYYQVTFDLANTGCSVADQGCPGYYNHFDAMFNGFAVYSANNVPDSNGAYVQYTERGNTGFSTTAALQFDLTNDSGEFYLDDITVTALGPTPEPASFALMMAGAAGLMMWLFGRKAVAGWWPRRGSNSHTLANTGT